MLPQRSRSDAGGPERFAGLGRTEVTTQLWWSLGRSGRRQLGSGNWEKSAHGRRPYYWQTLKHGTSPRVQDRQSATTANPRANANAVRRHEVPTRKRPRPVSRSWQAGGSQQLSRGQTNGRPWGRQVTMCH